MATAANLKTATVLAFERKLDPSDALLFSGQWDDQATDEQWHPIVIREKSVRGTISNRLKTKDQDPAKLDAAIENPNLQTVDVATLPAQADTLRATFTLRVLGGAGIPSACNNADYQSKLLDTVRGYIEASGFKELARRYAYNLANGRFLWRNRVGAEQIEVNIEHLENGQVHKNWHFNALSLTLRGFEAPAESTAALLELADLVAQGLAGNRHVLLRITAFARIGAGQEVFPSQELILNKDNAGGKSRTLYTVGGVAGIHSQKIGNALRTIDTWYREAAKMGPIAVEPYGSVTTQGRAFRKPIDKIDFYNLLDNWLLRDNPPALDQQHYVMATLIRGGVFGDAAKERWLVDYYVDLDLRPDPDFQATQLMSVLFAKLHRALATRSMEDIGVSFPEFRTNVPHLGGRMRLHGTRASLERLLDIDWLRGMHDHVALGHVSVVPPQTRHRVVRRVQVQSNPERMRRRLMRRHGLDAAQACQRIPDSAARFVHAPFVQLYSASTGQSFRLFIEHGPLVIDAQAGRFTSYGLSQTATVPWF